MMNSEARKRLEAQAELVDEDLLETEARLRDALRNLGAENPLRLSVGLARLVQDWTAEAARQALIGAADEADHIERIGNTRADQVTDDELTWFDQHPLRNLYGHQRYHAMVATWLRGDR